MLTDPAAAPAPDDRTADHTAPQDDADTIVPSASAAYPHVDEPIDVDTDSATDSGAAPAWAPRLNASHLAKGPNGIWYMRLTVPAQLRALHPGLPKELRRSTQTTHRCHALAKARKMCLDFLVKYSSRAPNMLALDQMQNHSFSLIYADGVIRVEHPPTANEETLILMARCWERVALQVLGRGQRAANDATTAPPLIPAPLVATNTPPSVVTTLEHMTPATPPQQTGDTESLATVESLWLSDAIDEWRANGGTTFSEQTWRSAYEATFRVFRELVSFNRRDRTASDGLHQLGILDIRMDQLTREHIASLHANLKLLPPNQGGSTKDTEALERIREGQKNKKPRPSRHSVEKKLGHIAPFMTYAKRKGWITQEVFDEMALALTTAKGDLVKEKQKGPQKKGYIALADHEVKTLFEQPAFLEGAMHGAWRYWVPLICLYLGTRVSEASQLYTDDILVRDGVHCVSFINDAPEDGCDDDDDVERHRKITAKSAEEYRRLKNKASRRIVPLHPKLIELGFLDFVKSIADSSRRPAHLFYGLTWEEKSMFGRKPSRYMRGLLSVSKIAVRRRKVPHSLRSNFHQCLDKTMLDGDLQKRLLGHSTGNMKDDHYNEADDGPAFPFARVLPYLAQVDFGINVPTWAEVQEQARIARAEGTLKRPAAGS